MPQRPKPVPPADWRGWNPPEYTPIPDALFDVWLPILTEGQLKVLLYIMRRTFGFKKAADAISLSQLCDGIVTARGERLDFGTGCTRSTVTAAVAALEAYGLITATPQTDPRGDAAPTLYRLRMAGETGSPMNRLPQSNERTTPGPATGPPVVQPADPQETVVQEAENKREERVDYSPLIAGTILEMGSAINDKMAPGAVTDALRLWQRSGLSEAAFVDALLAARGSRRRVAAVLQALAARLGL